MGNMVDFTRPTFGGPPVMPKDNSWTGITWDDFLRTRVPQNHIPAENGFNLCGYDIPEPALEAILCRLPEDEVLKCNFICRAWKDLLTRKSFWKKCFDHQGLDWNTVPLHIREKPEGWMVLYAQYSHQIFSKNYITNPSGHAQFEGWNIYKNGGDHWAIEDPPVGCRPVPEDPFFGPDTACFITSYQWCSKYFVVDLWKEGLKPIIMRISLPLEIKCRQRYSTRFDCGGVFRWELRILDSQEKIIRDHKAVMELPPSSNWETSEYSFKFKTGHADHMNQVRYLVFIHEGRDSQFWKGHYGMKFARASVTVNCLEEDPLDSEPEPDSTAHEDSSSDYGGHD